MRIPVFTLLFVLSLAAKPLHAHEPEPVACEVVFPEATRDNPFASRILSAFREINGVLVCIDLHTKGVDHVVGLVGPKTDENWEHYGFLQLSKDKVKRALSISVPENFFPVSGYSNAYLVCRRVDGCDRHTPSGYFYAYGENWRAIRPHLEAWSALEEKLANNEAGHSVTEQELRKGPFADDASYRIDNMNLFEDSYGRDSSQFYLSDTGSSRRWHLWFSKVADRIAVQSFTRLF